MFDFLNYENFGFYSKNFEAYNIIIRVFLD